LKKALTLCLLFSIILLIGCHSENKDSIEKSNLKGNISLSGAFALYPMVIKWKEEYNKSYPDVRIDVSAGGAGKGIADALSGLVNIGMVSRDISQSEIDLGAWFVPVAKDAVVGVVNANNPVIQDIQEKGFTIDILTKIFITGEIKTWGEAIGDPSKSDEIIQVYTRSDACGAADIWAKLLGKKQEDLNGIGVFGDPGIAQAIQNDKYGIGYNNIAFAYNPATRKVNERLKALPLDINKNGMIDNNENFYDNFDELLKSISDNVYPSPPARNLFLVTKQKPDNPLVINFLNWVLTEGQKFVVESGFIKLENETLKNAEDKLK
jgi:phosphate transport system substrate-binding protein